MGRALLGLPTEILTIIDTPADKRTPEQQSKLAAHYRTGAPSLKPVRDEIAALEKTKPATPTVPVMQELAENARRPNYIMLKGNFLAKGDALEPSLPSAFHKLSAEMPKSRLMVAQWLLSLENPLTARVAVN